MSVKAQVRNYRQTNGQGDASRRMAQRIPMRDDIVGHGLCRRKATSIGLLAFHGRLRQGLVRETPLTPP
jgi:hypothetical protein